VSIAYRTADEFDQRLVVSAWVRSYRDADTAGFVQVDDWPAVMSDQVRKALARPDVVATVAYETEDTERLADLYGFIVADVVETPPLVYYVFTKQAYRRLGIARGLFAAIGVDPARAFNYVCSTPAVSQLRRKIPMARWTPRLGRHPKRKD
jgi:GNAT superfamily N-acetyltransferase